MKKAILSVGILIWGILAVIVSTILVYAMFDLPKPGWAENLPATIWKGENTMIHFGGNTALLLEEDYVLDGIDTLRVIATYQDVTITLHDGADMRVRHYDYNTADPLTADFSGGSLTITAQKWNVFNIFGFTASPRLEIELPREYAGNADISSVSGTVKIEGDVSWGDVRLKTTSGSIRTGDISALSIDIQSTSGSLSPGLLDADNNVRLKATSGSIRGDDIRAGSVEAQSTSGSLNLGALTSGGSVRMKTVSGSIKAGNIKGRDVTSESTSGSQTLGAIDAAGMIRLTAVSGRVEAAAVRSPEHYIKTTSGSIRIGELTGTGEFKSTSGSVRTG